MTSFTDNNGALNARNALSALSDYCFWAPYKYSATTTTTTTMIVLKLGSFKSSNINVTLLNFG